MITKKVQTELCFGCGSCAAVCPVKAINMVRDKYGFLRPQVDEEICVNCNQCVEHCPVLTRKIQRAPVKKAVVVRADGAENSASGGAFFNLAKSLLTKPECFFQTTQKIFIAGTIWNEDFLPETVLTNDLATVEKMRGSKYVWGSTGNSYTETAAALKAGHMVFYSGTPCQIAGLYAFLGEDPDNLITLEILCHGGGAPIVWQSYLEFAGRKYGKRPAECKMQKAKGKIIFTFADGTHKIEDINKENEYVPLYMQGKTKRDCCLVCPFMGRVRNADIIVGDVWAKWAAKERNKGISLFIVNSPKAEMLLKHTHWQMMHHFDLDSRCNSPLNKINGNIPAIAPDREEILERFAAELPFEQAIKNKKVGLMNFNYPRDNYGALLLAFAMEKVVRDLGYEPYTINYYKNPITMNFDPQSAMWKFREKYLTLSGFAVEKRDLKQFNNMFEKFIFGSDVIWKACEVGAFLPSDPAADCDEGRICGAGDLCGPYVFYHSKREVYCSCDTSYVFYRDHAVCDLRDKPGSDPGAHRRTGASESGLPELYSYQQHRKDRQCRAELSGHGRWPAALQQGRRVLFGKAGRNDLEPVL